MACLIPFTIGEECFREKLLEFTGSKQRYNGIIYGDRAPGYVICASGGHHREIYGYEDEPMPSPKSGWFYFGTGGTGHQKPDWGGNGILTKADRLVLLFTSREQTRAEIHASGHKKKLFRYRGQFKVDGWDFFTPNYGKRAGNRLVRYRLLQTGPD